MDNEKLDKKFEKLENINKLRSELTEWKREMNTHIDKHKQSIEHAHKEIDDLKTKVSACASYHRLAEWGFREREHQKQGSELQI